MSPRFLVGLFVGGRATRMGGVPKGLLSVPETGELLVTRLARISREALDGAEVFLVGRHPAYLGLGLPALDDAPAGIGPLGGLAALLTEASARGASAFALAGDLPYATTELVSYVARHEPSAAAAAPKSAGKWEPLFARYDPAMCLPIVRGLIEAKRHALRGVLDELAENAATVPLDDAMSRWLADWDSPEDLR